jgi:REP element-mobilizing transposase RayT
VQSITFRLADAVPQEVIERWKFELEINHRTPMDDRRHIELRRMIDHYEDAGHGSCALRNVDAARIVDDALLFFDGERYRLIAWCVMPNQVHVLIEMSGFRLSAIIHSWKSFTAKEINKLLDTTGPFWFEEYHDRFIRDEVHFHNTAVYIEKNPMNAGSCGEPREWLFSSAARQFKENGGRDARGPRAPR